VVKKTSGKDIKNVNTEKGVNSAMMNKKKETGLFSRLFFFVGRAAALRQSVGLPHCDSPTT